MGCNRFCLNLWGLVAGIAGTALAASYFFLQREQYATAAFFLFLMLILAVRLFVVFNQTNRMLASFLDYLRDNDPSLELSGRFVRRNFQGLETRLQAIITDVRQKRIAEEMHARYLQTVVDHMDAGILIANGRGQITTINQTARKYLRLSSPDTLSGLSQLQPGLGERLEELRPGQSLVEKISNGPEIRVLSVRKALLTLQGDPHQIFAINDIRTELEDQELESWKKLIRIITHEIMNSITPITTLTAAIRRKFAALDSPGGQSAIAASDIRQGLESIDIIEERSLGVIHFIERYRKLTRIPPLRLAPLKVNELFDRMEYLFAEQLEERKIRLIREVHQEPVIQADAHLMEQVLINLVKNAVEALEGLPDPVIRLNARPENNHRVVIEVADNGCGIAEKDLDQVFVPFYSTKPEDSGIGLPFSKQVIRMHKGSLAVSSGPGKGRLPN